MSSNLSIEVCDNPNKFDELSHNTTLIEQYAGLSASDWREGFLTQLGNDEQRAQKLVEFTKRLAEPDSQEFESFTQRIRKSTEGGDVIFFASTEISEKDVLLSVVRARLYHPRNRFKKSYVYAPDLFVSDQYGAVDAARALVIRTHQEFDNSKLVVDAFSGNDAHKRVLQELGFTQLSRPQKWDTPANLAHIVGQTYQVTQFEHK